MSGLGVAAGQAGSPARIALEPCFVLHRRPYRESSLLLEIFCAAHGRLGLVARGARRPRSPLRTALEPFRPLLLSWSARGELGTLTGAEPQGRGTGLAGAALAGGFYVNELMLRLLHRHDPHPELFESYRLTLLRLARPAEMEPALRIFEKRLLESIGYGLVLDRAGDSEQGIDAGRRYRYVTDRGPVADAAGREELPAVRGSTLLALARERFPDAAALHEAKLLMRGVLGAYLGTRPLMSRTLIRERGATPGGAASLQPSRRDSEETK